MTPVNRLVIEQYPDGTFNMHSLFDPDESRAETVGCSGALHSFMWRGVELAKRTRKRTGEDVDLFGRLNELVVVLAPGIVC